MLLYFLPAEGGETQHLSGGSYEPIITRALQSSEVETLLNRQPEAGKDYSLYEQVIALYIHQYQEGRWKLGQVGEERYWDSIEEYGAPQEIIMPCGKSVYVVYRPYRAGRPDDSKQVSTLPQPSSPDAQSSQKEVVSLSCFLDASNQQPEQRGVLVTLEQCLAGTDISPVDAAAYLQEKFGIEDISKIDLSILVNPFMIFDMQLTAAANEHTPQSSNLLLFSLLNISRQLNINGIFNPAGFNASAPHHAHGQLMPDRLPIFYDIDAMRTDENQYDTLDLGLGYEDVVSFVPKQDMLYTTPVIISGKNIFHVTDAFKEAQKRLYPDGIEKASITYEFNNDTQEYTLIMTPRKVDRPQNDTVTISLESEDGTVTTHSYHVNCGFAGAEEGGVIVANRRNDLVSKYKEEISKNGELEVDFNTPEMQEQLQRIADTDYRLLTDSKLGPKVIQAIFDTVNEDRASFMKRLTLAT